jgi:RNA polymerase sigma factor (sigma-70 family)
VKEDIALRDRCVAGDRDAAGEFVRRYSDLVYRSIQHTLRVKHIACTPDDLSDLHNTVFVHLFENRRRRLRQFKGKNGCSLASWVRLITVRAVLNQLRKQGVNGFVGWKNVHSTEELAELCDTCVDPMEHLQRSEQMRLLDSAMQRLPSRDRLFLKLYLERGMTAAQIADVMHISTANVHTVKHRAIQRLKSYVAAMDRPRNGR